MITSPARRIGRALWSIGLAGRLQRAALAALAGALVLLPSHPVWAQGCAMCGTAITSAKDPLAKGMAISIVFMLLVPNLLILSIGGWIVYTYRRAALAQVAGSAPPLEPGDGVQAIGADATNWNGPGPGGLDAPNDSNANAGERT